MKVHKTSVIQSSEDFYNSIARHDPEFIEDDEVVAELIVDVDTYVSVDAQGDWEYCFADGSLDEEYTWAWNPDNDDDGAWEDEETGIIVASPDKIVELIDDAIFDKVPGAKGFYKMEGEFVFPYAISGREYTVTDASPEWEDREYDDANIQVEFDYRLFSINDLNFVEM